MKVERASARPEHGVRFELGEGAGEVFSGRPWRCAYRYPRAFRGVSFSADLRASPPPSRAVVGSSGNQTFLVAATDPGGQTLRWRLATDAESGGSNVNPPDYSIHPTTGQVTFDTTGKAEGLYHSAIVVEALDGASNVVSATQVTFLIRVGQVAGNQPPQFESPTPPDGSDFTVAPGSNLSLT